MTEHALENNFVVPETNQSLSANVFGDSSFRQSFGQGRIYAAAMAPESVVMDNPFPAGSTRAEAQPTPFLDNAFRDQIGKADSISFTSAAENQAAGAQPDYRVVQGADGKMVLEKVGNGDPLADGKLNIEVDNKGKESIAEAIKQADKNLKEYIREMMAYWRQNHPGKEFPGWWMDILNNQPNIPADAQPVPVRPAQAAPERQPQPQPSVPTPREIPQGGPSPAPRSSSGGGGGGGSSGGGGGGGGGAPRGGGGDVAPAPRSAPAHDHAHPPADQSDRPPLSGDVLKADGYAFPVVGYNQDHVNLHHGAHDAVGGTDIFAPRGTPVVAIQGGTVTHAGYSEIGGYNVSLKLDNGLVAYYAHLDKPPAVQTGQRVETGQQLGVVGDTGNAKGTGPHLHFGMGQDIVNGVGPKGGTGSNFNAVALLNNILENGNKTATA